ncbi:MAG: ABC transporter ATP-binding protein [Anaplasmataceae bacterium]|nr:ABC transporter ATP-binding protein [Anaplasmataceae bacterium]
MTVPILSAHKLKKTFLNPMAVEVLKEVSLDLYPGQFVAIRGRSGEGKSTLLHILGTLEKPDDGTLFISGIDTKHTNTSILRNEKIGFVFQTFNLLEDYTVLENVLMPARIARKSTSSTSATYDRAIELLTLVGLQERLFFPAKILSGGEKQRVAIARALINDPELLLADEPSGNLDHTNSQIIQNLLIDCARKQGKTLVIVTHDEELSQLADHSFILKEGQLL